MSRTVLRGLDLAEAELSVLLTDDSGIRELNRTHRGKDRPTDVLSFPLEDPVMIGDVVVSLERAKAQAVEYGVSEDEEMARLLVHGILHLAGYDHVGGGSGARAMRAREKELMALLQKGGFF